MNSSKITNTIIAICRKAFAAPGLERVFIKRALAPYLIALASVFAATVSSWVTVLFNNGKTPMVFFVIALIFSAGRGTGAGLFATALSVGVMLSIFKGSISIALASQSMVGLFVVISVAANVMFYELNRKNIELMKKNRALIHSKIVIETVYQQLLDQTESLAEANAQLAEQRSALSQAHEQLRLLGHQLANSIRVPLRKISVTTDTLARVDAARVDATFVEASKLIKTEVRRMDTLISQFAEAC